MRHAYLFLFADHINHSGSLCKSPIYGADSMSKISIFLRNGAHNNFVCLYLMSHYSYISRHVFLFVFMYRVVRICMQLTICHLFHLYLSFLNKRYVRNKWPLWIHWNTEFVMYMNVKSVCSYNMHKIKHG